jgi:hypothetical protein
LAETDKLKDSAAMKIDWQAGSLVSPPFYCANCIGCERPLKPGYLPA